MSPKLTCLAGGLVAQHPSTARRPLAPRISSGDPCFVYLADLWRHDGAMPHVIAAVRRQLLQKWGYRVLDMVTDELVEAVEQLRETA